jgi:hypothetical protein
LNSYCHIADKAKFAKDHAKAIKIIQWMEPLIVAVYGAPDPFASMHNYSENHKFSHASQRCAISRYIGLGLFNSDDMPSGKILTRPIGEIRPECDFWWFDEYYKYNAYTKLSEIGIDINYNKYYNHGIELRFLDHIPNKDDVFKSFELIVYLMDHIMDNDKINQFGNPITNKIWNQMVLHIMIHGHTYQPQSEEIEMYEKLFNMRLKTRTVGGIYHEIYRELLMRYNNVKSVDQSKTYKLTPIGSFSKLVLRPRIERIETIYPIVDVNTNIDVDIDVDSDVDENDQIHTDIIVIPPRPIRKKKHGCCNIL